MWRARANRTAICTAWTTMATTATTVVCTNNGRMVSTTRSRQPWTPKFGVDSVFRPDGLPTETSVSPDRTGPRVSADRSRFCDSTRRALAAAAPSGTSRVGRRCRSTSTGEENSFLDRQWNKTSFEIRHWLPRLNDVTLSQ